MDFKKFLASQTGQTLLARGRALECSTALKACQNAAAISPQRAAGFSDALNWFESLANVEIVQPIDFEESYTASSSLRYSEAQY